MSTIEIKKTKLSKRDLQQLIELINLLITVDSPNIKPNAVRRHHIPDREIPTRKIKIEELKLKTIEIEGTKPTIIPEGIHYIILTPTTRVTYICNEEETTILPENSRGLIISDGKCIAVKNITNTKTRIHIITPT